MDVGGASDPYCVVRVGNSSKHTAVTHATLEPEWKEVITFKVRKKKKERKALIGVLIW